MKASACLPVVRLWKVCWKTSVQDVAKSGLRVALYEENNMKLCVTHCSKKKRDGILAPDKLYNSSRIDEFTAYCKKKNLNWAILSAKYGLFFPEERRERYDVTLKSKPAYWLGVQVMVETEGLPKNWSDIRLKDLAKTVITQINKHSVQEVTYYYEENRGPLRPPKGYLALLHFVIDNCGKTHSWPELLECTNKCGMVHVATRLDFDP